jgi:hypothetical protein
VCAHLGEQGRPDRLDLLDLCGLDDRLELVGLFKLAMLPAVAVAPRESYSDVDAVIGEDESGVGGCELGGRHSDGCDREIVVKSGVEFRWSCVMVCGSDNQLDEVLRPKAVSMALAPL